MNAVASPAAVAERFRSIFLSEESGRLEVRSIDRTCSILFDRGMVAGAELIGAEAVPPPSGSREEAMSSIVMQAFCCVPESIEFLPGPSSEGDSQADILRTLNLFISGVKAMTAFEEIRIALLALDQRLLLKTNPTVPIERLTLQPLHGFVLSRLSGNLTFRDIAATIGPADEGETARFIYALLLLGCVALDPPFAHGPIRTELLLMDHKRDFAREESETTFIHEIYTAVQAQNPYQILGIDENASLEEIRRAYEERRRALSADRFLDKVRERMRSELSIIEARLMEVYLALQPGSPVRNAPGAATEEAFDFDSLALRREVTKTDVAVSISEQERLAESYFLKAKKYFGQGDYYNCIQYCTQAIRQNDQTARYYYLQGEAQIRNPDRRWQKMAEQSFLQSIKLDPWNADYFVTLGQFYKRQRLASRARRHFERALEIQPNHATASEELASLI